MTKPLAVVLALGLLVLAAPARAQSPPPDQDRAALEEAKALNHKAEIDFKLGHFEDALAEYGAAYKKYPTPGLLLNIGQCHRMLKNYEQAVFFYRGYLRDKPDAPNRAVVEGLIDEANQILEAQRAAADAQKAAAAALALQKRLADEQARAQPLTVVPPPASLPPAVAPSAASTHGGATLRNVGLATAGVGVAVIVTGIALGLSASSDSSQLEQRASQHLSWSASDQSLYNQGGTFTQAATALYVVGGVAVATGGVLAIVGWPNAAAESAPTLSVAPGPGGVTFVLRGVF